MILPSAALPHNNLYPNEQAEGHRSSLLMRAAQRENYLLSQQSPLPVPVPQGRGVASLYLPIQASEAHAPRIPARQEAAKILSAQHLAQHRAALTAGGGNALGQAWIHAQAAAGNANHGHHADAAAHVSHVAHIDASLVLQQHQQQVTHQRLQQHHQHQHQRPGGQPTPRRPRPMSQRSRRRLRSPPVPRSAPPGAALPLARRRHLSATGKTRARKGDCRACAHTSAKGTDAKNARDRASASTSA